MYRTNINSPDFLPLPDTGIRSFSLTSFQNHVLDAVDCARRFTRGRDKEFVYLDTKDAEERCRLEPVEFLGAAKIFDAPWTMRALPIALEQLRKEYAAAGKTFTFETLKVFLDPDNSTTPPSHEELANRLEANIGGVNALIRRFRRRPYCASKSATQCRIHQRLTTKSKHSAKL